jgi:hypothetical protein
MHFYLPHPVQACAQFSRRPEKSVLYRFFRRAEHIAYRPQPHSLMMLHLKNNPFAWRKPFHRGLDLLPDFSAQKLSFRVRRRPQLRLAVEEIAGATLGFLWNRRLIFTAARPAPQMIEPHIGHDPVKPRVKAALESESVQVSVDAQKALLIDVPGFFRPLHQVQGQAQNIPVVSAHKFLKRQTVPGLGLAD